MRRAILVFLLSSWWSTTHAQPTEHDAIALALFEDGRELAARGDFVHACEKFDAARARVPWVGVALNLADCYDHIGKSASAWALFRKVADDAAKRADPRADYARTRAAAIEPTLARVTIRRAGATAIEIRFDRHPVVAADLGVPLPVDPGEHLVEANAPDAIAWSSSLIVEPHTTVEISVPHLVPAPPVQISDGAIALPRSTPRARRWALPLATAGAIALGTSAVLGVRARRDFDAVRDHCDARLRCDLVGFDAIHDARRRGNIATITAGGGLAMIAGAVVLYWRAPREERTVVMPLATPTSVGIGVRGSL